MKKQKIEELRNSFLNYDKNCFFVDYINIEGNEISNIKKLQDNCQNSQLIRLWKEKCKSECFELEHPLYNNVITRAVYNFNDKFLFNFVFMVDEEEQHPWAFIQFRNFINGIVMPGNRYYIITKGWDGALENAMLRNSRKINFSDFFYKQIEFGFTFENSRPAHFFFELLSNYLQISHIKKYIFSENIFFKPNKFKAMYISNKHDFVYLFPTMLVADNKMQKKILKETFQESLSSYDALTDEDNLKQEYDLTIWLGLPGERRAWLEQIDGAANMLKHFNKYFKKIKVYVDGMTAYDGERQDFPENKALFNKVVDATRKLFLEEYDKNIIFTFEDSQDSASSLANEERFVVFKSLAGYDYRTKICYCNDCDIAIGDAGTTALVPFELCTKAGVIIFGDAFEEQIKRYHSLHLVKLILKEYLITNDVVGWSMNYHIPYQHIYNLAAEVLEELSRENKLKVKNLKMHRLEVPPVELIAKQYELEKQFEVKIPLENVEFVDKLATQLQQKDQIIQTKNQELEFKNQELTSKNQELTQTKNQLDTIKVQLDSTKQQLESKTKELSFLPIKKQTLEIKNLEQDLINKQLHTKQLEKELGYESNVLQELEIKKQELIQTKNQLDSTKKELELKSKQLESKNKILISNPNPSHFIQNTSNFKGKLSYLNTLTTAKDRIHNHLSYKLGQAMIENSKSLLGYIRMPYVLSYIKDKHKQEQQQYQEAIKKNPNLKLPNLESYPDYKESLKEKECLTYKLGEAFIKANKTWYKGGYVKLWFEVRKLKGERK